MKRNVLGLYLSEKSAQAVLLEQDGATNTLRGISEWTSTLFDYAGDDTPGVDEFLDRMNNFLATTAAKPTQVAVTMDAAIVFINTLPIDDRASQSDIKEHLEWELNEYFPGTPRDSFITDTHFLAGETGKHHDNVLMVSVRRDLVQKLHRSFARMQLKIDIVDVDHFSADTAMRINHPETADKFVALVGVKEGRIDVSSIRHNDMESYSYVLNDSEKQLTGQIEKLSKETKGLSSITLFGTGLTSESIPYIRNASSVPVELLNPLRYVEVTNNIRTTTDVPSTAYRYASSIGVALRRD